MLLRRYCSHLLSRSLFFSLSTPPSLSTRIHRFIKLELDEDSRKTPYIKDAEIAEWPDLQFTFREDPNEQREHRNDAVSSGQTFFGQKLTVTAYAHHRFRRRSFMGTAKLDLQQLLPCGRLEDVRLKLGPKPNVHHPTRTVYGSVYLTLTAIGPGVDPTIDVQSPMWSNPEFRRKRAEMPALGETGRDLFFKAFSL